MASYEEESLPRDVIIEILSWLPPETILKFKRVCRSWRSTITRDAKFIAKHNLRNKNTNGRIIIVTEDYPNPYEALKLRILSDTNPAIIQDNTKLVSPQNKRVMGFYRVTSSCNGLFCYASGPDDCGIQLCNPGARWATRIPHICFTNGSGLFDLYYGVGYDPFTNDYKVIKLRPAAMCPVFIQPGEVAIYSVKTKKWRRLDVQVPSDIPIGRICHVWMMKEYGVAKSWTKKCSVVLRNDITRCIEVTPGGKIMCSIHLFLLAFMDCEQILNALVDTTSNLNVASDPEIPQLNFEEINAFTLIGRILSEKSFKPNAVKNTLLKAWNPRFGMEMNSVEENKYAFIFKEKSDLDKVLNMAPWSFRGHLVILRQWDPDESVENINLDSALFWVQVRNLPVRSINTATAKIIGDTIGRFVKTDLVSESQRWRKALRIRVELNVHKPLTDSIKFQNLQGNVICVEIQYERLSDFCFRCGLIGHKFPSCPNAINPSIPPDNSSFPFGPWLRSESTLSVKPSSPPSQISPMAVEVSGNNPIPINPNPKTSQNPKNLTQNSHVDPCKDSTERLNVACQLGSNTCSVQLQNPRTSQPSLLPSPSKPLIAEDLNPDNPDCPMATLIVPDMMGYQLSSFSPSSSRNAMERAQEKGKGPMVSKNLKLNIIAQNLLLHQSPKPTIAQNINLPLQISLTSPSTLHLRLGRFLPSLNDQTLSPNSQLIIPEPKNYYPPQNCNAILESFENVPFDMIHSVSTMHHINGDNSEVNMMSENKVIVTERKITKKPKKIEPLCCSRPGRVEEIVSMRILSWNYRGIAHPTTRRTLRALLSDLKPDIVFLSELKSSLLSPLSSLLSSLNFSSQHFVPPIGFSRGLCMAWESHIDIQITVHIKFLINSLVTPLNNSPPWQFTCVHGPYLSMAKPKFWSLLEAIGNTFGGPWALIGDFNDIVSQSEKKGGRQFTSSSSGGLKGFIDDGGLVDLGFAGTPYTWNNKPDGMANIQLRLDRGLANSSWISLLPHASVTHLPAINSDHKPLLLITDPSKLSGPKPFRFENMWTRDASCRQVIVDSWAEGAHSLVGIKISQSSPPISHIMYADDLLIFGQAKEDNVECISDCISIYESWSGQMVSKEKSVIHFSNTINQVKRQAICLKLGFRECNHKSKHLGFPFCKPASRVKEFDDLINCVGKKLSGWKARNLSYTGRNVLIKGVAQSIPIYFLSLHDIPVTVCEKLDRMFRNFWWGDKDGKGNLRLCSWNFICSPKEFGGLGLRKLRDMNRALVSKLAWKICVESSLWTNFLRSKYLRDTHFLDQNETPRSSSKIWKSIMASKDSIKKGLCFTVSPSNFIRTWIDPWIPFISGFKPPDTLLNEEREAQSYLVNYFIDQPSLNWNVSALNMFFQSQIVSKILKIRIPSLMEPRRILWIPSKNGKFSVASSYLTDNGERFVGNQRGETLFWKAFWKTRVHEHFKIFLWRVLVEAIPTGAHLNRIIQEFDPTCILCHASVETTEHIFLFCPVARNAWWRSKWGFKTDSFVGKSMFEFVAFLLDKDNHSFSDDSQQLEFLQFAVCLMDSLWRNRNNHLHGNVLIPLDKLVAGTESKALEHLSAQLTSRKRNIIMDRMSQTSPLGPESLRVSVDAAFKNGNMCSRVVVRDVSNHILFAAALLNVVVDARDAELQAIREACNWLEGAPFPSIKFESDCLGMIRGIRNLNEILDWRYETLSLDLHAIFGSKPGWSMEFIKRDCNMLAHNICQWGLARNWKGIIPLNLLPTDLFCNEGVISPDYVPFFAGLI
ncbi:hypothetical protein BUALT_Bualt12G0079900 [Buddleja alternifolia]|uniref:F-box domain-containing protein n=1 Tax=Buddleja alternifolia TaxID=168488 RepID=A0AAV6WWT7_9LAMI|nr:hypothetical protein BUALT_Bualt12G0079900 [Buddleja alternifolia]